MENKTDTQAASVDPIVMWKEAYGGLTETQRELLGFIGGHWVRSLHIWQPKEDKLYPPCCELEKLGMLKRVIDEPGHVCFAPVEPAKFTGGNAAEND